MSTFTRKCEDNTLQDELNNQLSSIQESMSDIIDDINNLDFPDVSSLLNGMEDLLKDNPSNEVSSLSELAQVLGLPYNNDLERLALLGLGVIKDIGWRLSGDNFDKLRTLHELSGDNTYTFLNNDKPFFVQSTIDIQSIRSLSQLTYSDILSKVGTVGRYEILEEIEGEDYVYYIKKETFKSINETNLNDSPSKIFSYNEVTDSSIRSLKPLNIKYERTDISKLSKIMTDMVNADSLQDIQIKEDVYKEALYTYDREYVVLDKGLVSKLKEKNEESDITEAILQNYIKGVDTAITEDDLRAFIESVMELPVGTSNLSNKTIQKKQDNKRLIRMKLYILLDKIKNSESQEEVQDFIVVLLADISSDGETTKPNIKYKSYDSGSALVDRNISLKNTFGIKYTSYYDEDFAHHYKYRADISKKSGGTIKPIDTVAVDTMLDNLYSGLDNSTKLIGTKANSFLKDIESATSLGLSLSGAGAYENSFMKCAAGIELDVDFNPLGALLNALIDKINAAIEALTELLAKLLKELQCKIQCLVSGLGLGGVELDLPFCDIKVPPLLEVPNLIKFANLFDNLILQKIEDSNSLKFAILDLSDSFNTVTEDSCGCPTMAGFLQGLIGDVPTPKLPKVGGGLF